MLADHKIQVEKNFKEYIPEAEPLPDDPETSPARVLAATDIKDAAQIRIKIIIWNKTDKLLSYFFINEHGWKDGEFTLAPKLK
jgi:hypothetical protein